MDHFAYLAQSVFLSPFSFDQNFFGVQDVGGHLLFIGKRILGVQII